MPTPTPTNISAFVGAITIFGLAVAACYGALFLLHIVFALFLSLVIVCAIRGVYLHIYDRLTERPIETSMPPTAVAAA